MSGYNRPMNTHRQIVEAIELIWEENQAQWRILRRIHRRQLMEQADIDRISGQVTDAETHIEAVKTTLQAEIDRIAQQHPDVSLGGLEDAVNKLDPAVTALGELKPTETPPAEEPPAEEEKPAEEPPAEEEKPAEE